MLKPGEYEKWISFISFSPGFCRYESTKESRDAAQNIKIPKLLLPGHVKAVSFNIYHLASCVYNTFLKFQNWSHDHIFGPEGVFQDKFDDEAFAKSKLLAHQEQVKSTIPSENLLVFNISQGWEPLCAFLGKPVPNVPFPVADEKGGIQAMIEKHKGH